MVLPIVAIRLGRWSTSAQSAVTQPPTRLFLRRYVNVTSSARLRLLSGFSTQPQKTNVVGAVTSRPPMMIGGDHHTTKQHAMSSRRVVAGAAPFSSGGVKVTQTITTNTSSSNTTTTTAASESPTLETQQDQDSTEKKKKQKTSDQINEEEILTLQNHIRIHHSHAQYYDALTTSRTLLDKCIHHFGKSHPATASAYNNVGLMHKMLGEFHDSRINYHEALRIYGDIVGTDHSSYAAALNNLGNLDRTQSTIDEKLSGLERLQLNESAIEYFDEALQIRTVELGEHHPQTVTSRTNLGGAIAAQVLEEVGNRIRMMEKDRAREEGKAGAVTTGKGGGEDEKRGVDKEEEPILKQTKFTRKRWEAAEEHLRTALQTAVQNPRGERVVKEEDSDAAASVGSGEGKKSKKKKRGKRGDGAKKRKNNKLKEGGFGADVTVQTLSAASAAQNLAVFLKSRADVLSRTRQTDSGLLDPEDLYAEAQSLYQGSLNVRTELLPEHHPDTVATKFSLAELMSSLGDEDGANELRQEIMDGYGVTEKDAEDVEVEKSDDGDKEGGQGTKGKDGDTNEGEPPRK